MQQLTPKQVSDMLDKHHRLIASVAHSVSKRFHLPLADVLQEARLIAIKEFRTHWAGHYDPEKSSESTWIYQRVAWSLARYVDGVLTRKTHETPFSALADVDIETEAPVNKVQEILNLLGADATFLVRTILHDVPQEIASDISVKTCRIARIALKKYLGHIGWTMNRTAQAWNEVRACL